MAVTYAAPAQLGEEQTAPPASNRRDALGDAVAPKGDEAAQRRENAFRVGVVPGLVDAVGGQRLDGIEPALAQFGVVFRGFGGFENARMDVIERHEQAPRPP